MTSKNNTDDYVRRIASALYSPSKPARITSVPTTSRSEPTPGEMAVDAIVAYLQERFPNEDQSVWADLKEFISHPLSVPEGNGTHTNGIASGMRSRQTEAYRLADKLVFVTPSPSSTRPKVTAFHSDALAKQLLAIPSLQRASETEAFNKVKQWVESLEAALTKPTKGTPRMLD